MLFEDIQYDVEDVPQDPYSEGQANIGPSGILPRSNDFGYAGHTRQANRNKAVTYKTVPWSDYCYADSMPGGRDAYKDDTYDKDREEAIQRYQEKYHGKQFSDQE